MRHEMDSILLTLAGQLARVALQEDVGRSDVTGEALLDREITATAELRIKQDGVLCAVQWIEVVFGALGAKAEVEFLHRDGDRLRKGTIGARITATQTALAATERTVLNLIQRLSGIATLTARFVDAVEGTRAMIYDTRKTTPGLRAFEKYAVTCGGGVNHRMGLYDEAMVKENHLCLSGMTVDDAIARVRERHEDIPVTAEAEDLAEAKLAVDAGADVVLLDEFSLEDIRAAVAYRGDSDEAVTRTKLEVSGGVTLENVRSFAETGVERISIGALTHSAPALDISLKVVRE